MTQMSATRGYELAHRYHFMAFQLSLPFPAYKLSIWSTWNPASSPRMSWVQLLQYVPLYFHPQVSTRDTRPSSSTIYQLYSWSVLLFGHWSVSV
jgi:hypothetical protein